MMACSFGPVSDDIASAGLDRSGARQQVIGAARLGR
jgi:hypothetical protein